MSEQMTAQVNLTADERLIVLCALRAYAAKLTEHATSSEQLPEHERHPTDQPELWREESRAVGELYERLSR